MSMFGRSPNAPTGAVNPERVEMAIQECGTILSASVYGELTFNFHRLDMVTDIFNRLVSQVAWTYSHFSDPHLLFQDMSHQVY